MSSGARGGACAAPREAVHARCRADRSGLSSKSTNTGCFHSGAWPTKKRPTLAMSGAADLLRAQPMAGGAALLLRSHRLEVEADQSS